MLQQKEKCQKYYSAVIKFNAGPKLGENQLGEAEEQVGERAKGISCPRR